MVEVPTAAAVLSTIESVVDDDDGGSSHANSFAKSLSWKERKKKRRGKAKWDESSYRDGQKNTLQKAINQLSLERKKVQADISYTENKISSTDLEINKITFEIGLTEKNINQNQEAIRHILRTMNINDQETMIEILLQHKNISEFWNAFEELQTVKNKMSDK